jgi:hypothetical protein
MSEQNSLSSTVSGEVNTFGNSTTTSATSDTSSDYQNKLSTIIAKLGHELDEIRTRALDNLISKLNNNVIAENDLANYKQLFIKLFELFNYAEFNQHEKLLDLILRFTRVSEIRQSFFYCFLLLSIFNPYFFSLYFTSIKQRLKTFKT